MKKLFSNMVDSMCEDCSLYRDKKGYLWLINTKTNQWVVHYYPPTNYAWWNYRFFETAYKFLSMDIDDKTPIKNWIQTKMNVEVGLCEPNMSPGNYDWSDDFKFEKVILDGEVLNFKF